MKLSQSQSVSLFILRVLIGWHFLYEGLVKILDPNWTSAGYLKSSQWIFANIFHGMADSPAVLTFVDLANEWGLFIIGLGLIIGIYTRFMSWAGMFLILLYYFSMPPLPGLVYSMPMEGHYLIVNKNLIEAGALLILAVFPSGLQYGVDLILKKRKKTF
jgi:thiosulfate dehydrogenase [quinone] large subunit